MEDGNIVKATHLLLCKQHGGDMSIHKGKQWPDFAPASHGQCDIYGKSSAASSVTSVVSIWLLKCHDLP